MTKDFMKSAGFQNYELLRDDQKYRSFVFPKTNYGTKIALKVGGVSKSTLNILRKTIGASKL